MTNALELLESPNEELDSVEGNQHRSLQVTEDLLERSETILYGVGGKRLPAEAGAALTGQAEGEDIVRTVVKAIAADGVLYQWCNGCCLFLPLEAFTSRASGRYGKDYTCRVCKRKWNHGPAAKSKYRRFHQSYKGHLANKKRWKSQRDRFPEKHRARQIVYEAIQSGVLVRPSVCSKCGCSGRIEGHHVDYSVPLQVEWLCTTCHRKADV